MDWNDFAKRLTIELMRLPVGAFLIVQDPGGLPYVQAMRADEEIDAEAVGSAFLPRPLAPAQERRLTVNGWERPDGRDRRNWWCLVSTVDRSGRPARDIAERCAALAGRMVAAFRDVYGAGSPRDLVYQAGSTEADELGGPMDLPGLGIPRAVLEEDEAAPPDQAARGPAPAARLETALAAARERGDRTGYMTLLTRAVLYLPSPTDPTYEDASGHRYATAVFGDETFVLAFTSPAAMDRSLRGQAVHHRQAFLSEMVRHWPNPQWQLAVNPGLASAAYLDALALFPDSPPRTAPPAETGPPAETATSNGHAPTAPPPENPAPRPQAAPRTRPEPAPPDVVVMQKVVPHDHVTHYLTGGYDLVAGYVHRLPDVRGLNTPAALIRGLGLVYEGTPFQPGDEAIHVIRWPAVRPTLFRKPLGGIDEWSMSLIPGGWVIEKAPFPGSGYAPGEGPAIPEFKIASQRLPHGAEMYRIERSGREWLVAGYDADRRRWLLRPGAAVPAPPGAGREVAREGRA